MPPNTPALSEARRYLIALLAKDCSDLRFHARIARALGDADNAGQYEWFARTLADLGDAMVRRIQAEEGYRFGNWTPTMVA